MKIFVGATDVGTLPTKIVSNPDKKRKRKGEKKDV